MELVEGHLHHGIPLSCKNGIGYGGGVEAFWGMEGNRWTCGDWCMGRGNGRHHPLCEVTRVSLLDGTSV